MYIVVAPLVFSRRSSAGGSPLILEEKTSFSFDGSLDILKFSFLEEQGNIKTSNLKDFDLSPFISFDFSHWGLSSCDLFLFSSMLDVMLEINGGDVGKDLANFPTVLFFGFYLNSLNICLIFKMWRADVSVPGNSLLSHRNLPLVEWIKANPKSK